MDDLISRQTVINMLNDINAEVNDGCGYMYEHWMDYIKQLPSVTSKDVPDNNIGKCEDAISRREAIKIFTYNYKGERISDYDCDNFPVQIVIKKVKKMLRELPSASQRIGHWIDDGYYADNSNESVWRCSECDHHIIEYDMEGYKFCPNCGAYMRGYENE